MLLRTCKRDIPSNREKPNLKTSHLLFFAMQKARIQRAPVNIAARTHLEFVNAVAVEFTRLRGG